MFDSPSIMSADITAKTSRANTVPASLEPSPSRNIKLWYDEARRIYEGNSTGKEYIRYNNNFIVWHNADSGAGSEILEEQVRKYIS
jgi:hypothetical protein